MLDTNGRGRDRPAKRAPWWLGWVSSLWARGWWGKALVLILMILIVLMAATAYNSWIQPKFAPFGATIEVRPADSQATISRSAGVVASGRYDPLDLGDSLWLMDDDGITYTIDGEADLSPNPLLGNTWTARSVPIGDKVGDVLKLAIVRADSDCANVLRERIASAKPDAQQFSQLPTGCDALAKASVTVSRR